jgi:type II secretory ATPase GspE/PulE/Tfp pilus assembly ATPase PilB-like protein
MSNEMIEADNVVEEDEDQNNDIYGISRFEEGNVNKVVERLKGLDKITYEYLSNNKLLTEMGLRQACMEMLSTGRDFVTLMLNQGNIKQGTLVSLSLKIDPDELSAKELIEPSIPYQLLKQYKIMLSAITDTHIYLSTLGAQALAEQALKPLFPHHMFYFTSAKVNKILEYLEKVERYGKQSGTLLEVMVRKAIREKVSDIHIYPTRDGYNIKTRYLGQLYVESVGGMDEYLQLVTKSKTLSGLDPTDRRTPQDGSFRIDYNGRQVDLRVATCPTLHRKETVVIRVLDPENSQVHIDELGITEVAAFKKACRSSNGIVLVCGVTGSGKTTTIASTLRTVVDRFSKSINTIEDPVENEISDIKQTQIDVKSGVTFPKVLRSILRQDPDIVVVGEVRDEETAKIMFTGAETGHLLLGTIHIKDIPGVITRLENLGVEREKILNQLRGILVQKLLRVVCQKCNGRGCEHCFDKGYTSRTVVSECIYLKDRADVLRITDPEQKRWWTTVLEDAYGKYRQGITDRAEMVSAFGSDFEVFEDERAAEVVSDVISGKVELSEFEALYPTHSHLLESRAL